MSLSEAFLKYFIVVFLVYAAGVNIFMIGKARRPTTHGIGIAIGAAAINVFFALAIALLWD